MATSTDRSTDASPPAARAAPRLSTTVMLLRDAPRLEVLMVRRAHEIDFASGALVFPGGKVEAADDGRAWAGRLDGAPEGLAAEGLASSAAAVRVAAARECFEEVGVLLARKEAARGAGAPLVGPEAAAALSPERSAVERDAARFAPLLREAGFVLALDALVPFARWVAPPIAPKRFDTFFFIAAMPPGQSALEDGREATSAEWIAPSEAAARAEAGAAKIIFPTRMNLRRLAVCGSCEDALRRFAATPPPTVRPVVETDADGRHWLSLPEEAGYGAVRERLHPRAEG